MKHMKWLSIVCVISLLAVMMPLCFTATATEAHRLGDADGDGDITMKDVLLVRQYIAGMTTELDKAAADTDQCGVQR